MKKLQKISVFLFTLTLALTLTRPVYAICPVCTVAVGAGLGLSRWLGIDDTVSGIWLGGLIMSSSLWIIAFLKRKKPELPITNYQLPTILLTYFLFLYPLTLTKIIGHPLNTILGIDKIIFGTAVGSAVFLLAVWADKKVRKLRGKQLFYYQKVAFPVVALAITSFILYYYGGHLY